MSNRSGVEGVPPSGVSPTKGYPPTKKLSLFLRNCKIVKKYEITTYTVYYLRCNREMVVIECDKDNNCIETVRVKL
jgi:hypothetical protein